MVKRSHKSAFGFTYLWVLIAIALLSIGSLVGVEAYETGMRREKEQELLRIGREFRAAIGSYYNAVPRRSQAEVGSNYPSTLQDLLLDTRFPNVRRHLRRIYVDPLTGRPEWGLVTLNGRIVGVHSMSEAVPIKAAGFEAAEAEFMRAGAYKDWVFVYRPE
jgi:type II secretory pathway pseudopilin PulG